MRDREREVRCKINSEIDKRENESALDQKESVKGKTCIQQG